MPADMSQTADPIRDRLRELERALVAFERGERGRLYESRDSMLGLAEAVDNSGLDALSEICDIANRLLGILLMEGSLSEGRSVSIVRELLAHVEKQVSAATRAGGGPGGVFHVVNAEPIGEILLRQGLITRDQLEEALALARAKKGRRVGQVLVAMNAIDEKTLEAALAAQKADSRRAETRRSGGAAQPQSATNSGLRLSGPTSGANPLPPLPGLDGGE